MRQCLLTNEELQRMIADRISSVDAHSQPDVRSTNLAIADAFQELLARRLDAEAMKKSGVALKLAMAHVSMLRDHAVDKKMTASAACLEMQLELLKQFDTDSQPQPHL
jgi:predicted ABC-class ATPase